MASSGAGALIIACGALAREIAALRRANGWDTLDVQCLPAELHNEPQRIPEQVRTAIRAARGRYRTIFVAYADCGTGGRLDAVLQEEARGLWQMGKANVGNLETEIVVVVVEANGFEIDVTIFVFGIEFSGDPEGVVRFLDLAALEIGRGCHIGELRRAVTLVQKLVCRLDGRRIVSGVHVSKRLIITGGVRVPERPACHAKLSSRGRVGLLFHQQGSGGKVAGAVVGAEFGQQIKRPLLVALF